MWNYLEEKSRVLDSFEEREEFETFVLEGVDLKKKKLDLSWDCDGRCNSCDLFYDRDCKGCYTLVC